MSPDYWAGLLTPVLFAVAVTVLYLALGWLIAMSRRAWGAVHFRLIARADLARNPEYEDAANRLRDALIRSPRLYSATGLGWMLLLVRDQRPD